jgi:3-isopropylmalate/(R)-2-methylmalate dehydratase small subunit
MQDAKRITISGQGIVLRGNDIDTDRIIPARYLRTVVFDGLGEHAFEDDRAQLKQGGQVHAFDDPKFESAEILLVNKNFGCGSSREHAPQAIKRAGLGIKAIVGESFAEIFFGNCVSLGIPCAVLDAASMERLMATIESEPKSKITVDIQTKTLKVGDSSFPIVMGDGVRQQFLEGRWDTTAELLANKETILATSKKLPYFTSWS